MFPVRAILMILAGVVSVSGASILTYKYCTRTSPKVKPREHTPDPMIRPSVIKTNVDDSPEPHLTDTAPDALQKTEEQLTLSMVQHSTLQTNILKMFSATPTQQYIDYIMMYSVSDPEEILRDHSRIIASNPPRPPLRPDAVTGINQNHIVPLIEFLMGVKNVSDLCNGNAPNNNTLENLTKCIRRADNAMRAFRLTPAEFFGTDARYFSLYSACKGFVDTNAHHLRHNNPELP